MKQKKKRTRAGSEAQYGPRLAGEILHDYLENSNDPLAVNYRDRKTNNLDGWNKNTVLSCILKTLLRSEEDMDISDAALQEIFAGQLRVTKGV